jgi:cyclic pyranopterin phosphate synthase
MSSSQAGKTAVRSSGFPGRVLIVNPPLEVPPVFIDYPPFSFLAPYIYADILRKSGFDAVLLDCFVHGVPVQGEKGVLLGGRGIERIADAARGCDRVVIHYSPFQRHEAIVSTAMKMAVEAARGAGARVALADFYDGSSHYIDYRTSEAVRAFPGVESVFRMDRIPFTRLLLRDKFREWGLSSFPEPGRHLKFTERCADLSLIKDVAAGGAVFPYLASTGCPHRCIFCTNSIRRWTGLPLENVKSDWSMLAASGVRRVVILDQYANMQLGRFKELLRLAASLRLRLHFANGVGLGKIDEETAGLISNTVDRLYVSPESGDAATAARLGKPFQGRKAEESIGILRRRGVEVHAHFIVGAPWETRAAVNRSLSGIAAMAEGPGVRPHVQPFVPRNAFRAGVKNRQSIYGRFNDFMDPWLTEAVANLKFREGASGSSKLIINVSYKCSNNCSFCSIADRVREDGSFLDQARALAAYAAKGFKLLDIDGGEPLLYPGLADLLDLAESLGYGRITLTTNGRLLSSGPVLATLGRRGSLDVLVSVHGSTPMVHDSLTRSPGSFDETVLGISAAVAAGLAPGVNATLTSRNAADLPAIAKLAGRLGARVLNIQCYTPFGVVDPSLAPGAGAVGRLREAVYEASGCGMGVNLVNFPYCTAPDLAGYMKGDFFKEARLMLFCDGRTVNLAEYLGARRYRTPRCDSCRFSILCRGFWDYGAKAR